MSSDESKLRRYQQELEQSWVEVRQAEAGREAAEQSLQQIQAQLEESKIKLEELSSELLSQQKHSECGEAAVVARLFFNLDLFRESRFVLFFFSDALHHSLHIFTPDHSCVLGSFSGTVGDEVLKRTMTV